MANLARASKNKLRIQYKSRFLVSHGNALISISASEAAYFYAEGNFVCLHNFEGKKYHVKYALNAS